MTNDLSPRLVVLDDPQSLSAEAYRVLRMSLHYATSGTKPRSVLITSADMGAGKSTITANLGILLAQIDRSVLLVDADLRHPVLHTLLQVPGALGLSSYLSGRAALEAVVTRTSVPKLFLMPSGPIPPNPSDLLSSHRMRDLLKTVAEQYDLVLLDSPPVLAASDATTLAPVVDGILLVVGSGVPELSLRRAKDQLEAVHGRILGAVVNQREVRHAGHRARGGLSRVPQAAAVRLGGAGRAAATLGAGAAGTSLRGLRHVGDRARDGLSRVPQAAAVRLGGVGRTVAAYRAGVAETGRRAMSGLAGISQAGAARLGGAGRAVATLGAGIAGTSHRAGHRAMNGLAGVSRAGAVRLGDAGRAVATLGAGVAGMSLRGLRHVGDRALGGLSRVPQAAARLGGACRAAAAYGAGVAATSHRAGRRATSGLAGVSQAWAARLGGAGRAVATLGAGIAGTSLHGLRHVGDRARDGLSRVPQAAARLRDASRAVATLGIAVAETSQRQLGYVRDRALRTTMTTALSGFATGLALVYIATGFLGWPAVPLDRTPPVTARASTGPGPRLAPSAKATSPPRGLASGPAAEVRHPSAASPASPPEVVAIRFGVIDRRRLDWTWSWRVTIHTPDDTARVNARIEYIEFQGSTRRLVGYEELCGLRLAHGRLESIEGIRTISSADSRRISTMTATVSAATEGADSTTCHPSSAGGHTPLARGLQVGV